LGESSFLRNETIKHLNHNRVFVLVQVSVAKNLTTEVAVWRSSANLGLTGNLADEWNNYTIELNGVWVTLHSDEDDALLWMGGDKKGDSTVKNCYEAIFSLQELPVRHGCQRQFWKWHLPLKVKLFFWLAFHNRILT